MVFLAVAIFILLLAYYFMIRPKPVYLVDYACYRPPDCLKLDSRHFIELCRLTRKFDEASIDFQRKVIERSGLGNETYEPEAMHTFHLFPSGLSMSMSAARLEAVQSISVTLDNLFKSTQIEPRDVGILVVNCSGFNPVPSLSSIIVNKYKLRASIRSFNIVGMGCSAGLIAVGLAKDMLRLHRTRTTYAIVVSTEPMTQNRYFGKEKSMLIPNCLFKVGASALLLSNNFSDKGRAKYKLVHAVRTHTGAHDASYKCVYGMEDGKGNPGLFLSKNLTASAGEALRANIRSLGPLVLPFTEKLRFLMSLFALKPCVPDFKLACKHFCVHAGGKAVIDMLEKNLNLSPQHVEASRMTLHRFGNTSSSSIWYEMAYLEAKGRIKKGDRVWQIAFGSGFKCNSAIWEAVNDVKPTGECNPWLDFIHRYPVQI